MNFSKLMFGEAMQCSQVLFEQILLRKVQGEPVGKILLSDLPTGGSADHVDQRGV